MGECQLKYLEHNCISVTYKSGKEWQKIKNPTPLDKISFISNIGKKQTERTDY